MSLIGTKLHAVFMYAFSAFMIAAALSYVGDTGGAVQSEAIGPTPYAGQAAVWVVTAAGALIIVLNLLTDFELAWRRSIPLRVTQGLEVLIGALLAASPWLLRFAWLVAWPHVVAGLVLIGVALITGRHPRKFRLG